MWLPTYQTAWNIYHREPGRQALHTFRARVGNFDFVSRGGEEMAQLLREQFPIR